MCQALRDKILAGRSKGEPSSGGIGYGLPATKSNQSSRMARTSSAASFMALFGPPSGMPSGTIQN